MDPVFASLHRSSLGRSNSSAASKMKRRFGPLRTSCLVGDPFSVCWKHPQKNNKQKNPGEVVFLLILILVLFVLKVDFRDSENGSFSERPDRKWRLEAS